MIKIPSSSSPIMSTHSPSLWKILSETWRIIASHPRHFLTLSALFLLPVSITSAVYLFLEPQPTSLHTFFSSSTPQTGQQLLVLILVALSTVLISLCANSSISYSTFSAFNDEPVKLTRSLRTIIPSFFPLLSTYLATQVILGVIIFAFVLVAYVVLALIGSKSRFFLVFGIIATVVLVMLLFYLLMEWCLSFVVVVFESSWGLAPLRRSSYLVKGNRKVAYSLFLMYLVAAGILEVWCLILTAKADEVSKVWIFAQISVKVVLSTALGFYGLAATTVLYIYCKARYDEKEHVLVSIAELP